MESSITANTEINVVVNGVHTFSIENSPRTGLLWIIKSNMDLDNYTQGLLAIAETSHNLLVGKIKTDEDRVKNCNDIICKG